MDHSPGFLKLVEAERRFVKEITIADARQKLASNPASILLDVREDHEWAKGHAAEAQHLGKGILERDLERLFPDAKTEILMYCGGGFRSVLTAAAARKLGYENCHSIIGGYKAMVESGWPLKSKN
jgi:rhodanese-related sulfurtransferase